MPKKFIINNSFFRLLVPIFGGILAYLLILLLNNDIGNLPEIFKGQEVYLCIFLTYLISESHRILIRIFNKGKEKLSSLSIVTQLIAGSVITTVIITFCLTLYFDIAYGFSVSDTQLVIFNVVYILLTFLYQLLFISNFYYQKQNDESLQMEEQLRLELTRDMQAFRLKVNPQLLYSSLETLITVVHKDVNEAEDFIDHLSAVYRHILSNRKIDLVTLETEMRAVKNILFILNHEYNNKIFLETSLSLSTKDILLIPGTLTILVEQVVRKNIITPLSPMRIEIFDEPGDGYLVIKNTLNERLTLHPTFDEFYGSLQKSYYYYSEKPIVIVKADRENFLKLPLLKENVEKNDYVLL